MQMKRFTCVSAFAFSVMSLPAQSFRVPPTGQNRCYDANQEIKCPDRGQAFFGQDAQNAAAQPALVDNGDGTVSDRITGLMWTKSVSDRLSWTDARDQASSIRAGGHADWRLPSIKELYTIIDFRGDFSPRNPGASVPFIDAKVFDFQFRAASEGRRFFDVQIWSSTRYVSTTMRGDASIFGVNFADGRIKAYPEFDPPSRGTVPNRMLARYVRGRNYGKSVFRKIGDGTVLDASSRLQWQESDNGKKYNWQEALAFCSRLDLGGKRDWRLPNAKELHTIVDYTRAPGAGGPAVDPAFAVTETESYFWTSTTVVENGLPIRAAYFAFGRAMGWMQMPPGFGSYHFIDVHGAGAQRADLKDGDPAEFPHGFGPQGDDVRTRNFVRCVRTAR